MTVSDSHELCDLGCGRIDRVSKRRLHQDFDLIERVDDSAAPNGALGVERDAEWGSRDFPLPDEPHEIRPSEVAELSCVRLSLIVGVVHDRRDEVRFAVSALNRPKAWL